MLDEEQPNIDHFEYDYAVAIVSNDDHWKNTTIQYRQQLLLTMAAKARHGAVFILPNKEEYRQLFAAEPVLNNEWLLARFGEVPAPSITPLATLENIASHRLRFRVPIEKCRDLNGWAYTDEHYFIKTLAEYPDISTYEGSSLEYYYNNFCPENRQQQFGLKGEVGVLAEGWPFNPWRRTSKIRKKSGETRKGGNHLHGPNTLEFGQAEFKRLVSSYNSLAKNGYEPELYSDGFITGYFLSDGTDYRFVVTEGQHRLPALYQLGYTDIDVVINKSVWFPFKCVERALVEKYYQVQKGIFTVEQALAWFDHYFQGEQQFKFKNKKVLLTINGKVQSVGYRRWAEKEAKLYGLKGWVGNTDDGKVKMLISGTESAVDDMIKQCKVGPSRAKVSNITVENYEGDVRGGFNVFR